jgi:hypothetical protein
MKTLLIILSIFLFSCSSYKDERSVLTEGHYVVLDKMVYTGRFSSSYSLYLYNGSYSHWYENNS